MENLDKYDLVVIASAIGYLVGYAHHYFVNNAELEKEQDAVEVFNDSLLTCGESGMAIMEHHKTKKIDGSMKINGQNVTFLFEREDDGSEANAVEG